MRLVLATSNPGKLAELQGLLAPLGLDVRPLSEFTNAVAEETGLCFVENAILKARHAARAASLPAIADDSGLEVDALGGDPGIRSARYAGPGASDSENVSRLLQSLKSIAPPQRTARFRCALVFMRHALDPAPIVCQASWEGRIARARRGHGGFGYDPVFEVAGLDATAAELPAGEKNRLSHRGQALRALARELEMEFRRAST